MIKVVSYCSRYHSTIMYCNTTLANMVVVAMVTTIAAALKNTSINASIF